MYFDFFVHTDVIHMPLRTLILSDWPNTCSVYSHVVISSSSHSLNFQTPQMHVYKFHKEEEARRGQSMLILPSAGKDAPANSSLNVLKYKRALS